jgi:hypothetical protein
LRAEPLQELIDPFSEFFGHMRAVLQVVDRFGEAAVDTVCVIKEEGRELSEALKVFDEHLLSHSRLVARACNSHALEIEFGQFWFAVRQ